MDIFSKIHLTVNTTFNLKKNDRIESPLKSIAILFHYIITLEKKPKKHVPKVPFRRPRVKKKAINWKSLDEKVGVIFEMQIDKISISKLSTGHFTLCDTWFNII